MRASSLSRRWVRSAILWCSLLAVSGCSRTESIEVIWKNCWRGGVLRPFQAFIDDVPGRVLGVVAAVLPADQIGDLGKAQREGIDLLRDLQSVREGQADFPDVAVVVAVSAVPWGYAGETRALKICGRSCQPLICWTVRIKTRLPAGGRPNLAA